jgi:protein gp37
MAQSTEIEWTDATWNPVTGCTKISRGCQHCYAERISERFRGVKGHPYEQGFDLRLWPERLTTPDSWRRSRFIFVNSMSDLFHKKVGREFVGQVFDTMERANQHIYQVLTKRSSILHIWLGVSVEDRQALSRVQHLRDANVSVRFLSIEPLLDRIGKINLKGIHWVIVGGESGYGFRPTKPEWVREIRDQCLDREVPFFFKQWGGLTPKAGGNELDGRVWLDYPTVDILDT